MFVVGVSTVAPVIGALEVATPVADSRLPVGGEIVSVDGSAVRSWEDVNLRLAARVGESGVVRFGVKSAPASEPINIDVRLDSWKVDLEKETPLNAIGIVPYRPAVKALIGQVVDGGAASKAGLEVNDLVTAANGQVIEDWIDLVHIVQQSANRPVELEIKRGDRQMLLQMVPEGRVVDSGELQGYIGAGVMPPTWPDIMLRTIEYGPIEAISAAFNKTIHMISLTLDSIWKMIEGVISVKNLSGPITIAKVAGASAASGFEPFISFLAYLSISLGVLNLLPIPVLDGGHLLYYMVELVRGKPVSEKVQEIGFKLGMVVLLSLMTLAIFNDFMRL
jgi:regulator of sigma E protease